MNTNLQNVQGNAKVIASAIKDAQNLMFELSHLKRQFGESEQHHNLLARIEGIVPVLYQQIGQLIASEAGQIKSSLISVYTSDATLQPEHSVTISYIHQLIVDLEHGGEPIRTFQATFRECQPVQMIAFMARFLIDRIEARETSAWGYSGELTTWKTFIETLTHCVCIEQLSHEIKQIKSEPC